MRFSFLQLVCPYQSCSSYNLFWTPVNVILSQSAYSTPFWALASLPRSSSRNVITSTPQPLPTTLTPPQHPHPSWNIRITWPARHKKDHIAVTPGRNMLDMCIYVPSEPKLNKTDRAVGLVLGNTKKKNKTYQSTKKTFTHSPKNTLHLHCTYYTYYTSYIYSYIYIRIYDSGSKFLAPNDGWNAVVWIWSNFLFVLIDPCSDVPPLTMAFLKVDRDLLQKV